MTPPVRIPYVNLARQHQLLLDELAGAAREVLAGGQFILGEPVREFETRFAEYCGAAHAVAMNSGTDALVLVLEALGIQAGQEVITAPNSFIATATAVARCGAKPVFVDVGSDYNLDAAQVAAAINHRTRAILPVHLTGCPADMPALRRLASEHQLLLVEDCAQAVGATIDGQHVGRFGNAGCFSLHPLKTLGACGDAGVVITDDSELCDRLRVSRNLGLADRDTAVAWGHNSRLDSLQAALLLVKFNHLDEWTQGRQRNAAAYRTALADIRQLELAPEPASGSAVYHTFVVQAERRDALRRFLREQGIETGIHYPVPIHLQPVAQELGYQRGDFPVAERQADRILSLPIYAELTAEEINDVADCMRAFYDQSSHAQQLV